MRAPSPLELDAILISRLVRDGDHLLIGAGLPAPRAGALLAALTHAPNARLCQALGWIDVHAAAPRPPRPGMDLRDAAGSEAWLRDYEAYDDVRRLSNLFVLGGFEIDRMGATNLLGLYDEHVGEGDRLRAGGGGEGGAPGESGEEDATRVSGEGPSGRWRRRGPGAIGTTSMAVLAERTVVYATRHDPATFVERCSIASTPGWRGARDGPVRCLSPAGVFDFRAPERQMRLLYVRPGWTVEEVQAATGFPLAGLEDASALPVPGDDELEALRTLVDPEGVLA